MSAIHLNSYLRSNIERFSNYLCKDFSAMSEEEAAKEAILGFRPATKCKAIPKCTGSEG